MDRLAFYLVPLVVKKFKIGTSWQVVSDGRLIGAARVRGKRREIKILKFEGSQEAWDILKDYSIEAGLRLKKKSSREDEPEDYQDWYERHLRPSTGHAGRVR
jgi:hypothetical protein